MKTSYLSNAGLLVLTAAMFIGLRSEAQEGRTSGAGTRMESAAGPGQRAGRAYFGPERQRSAEILSAQFQATVYEVQAAAERLGSLDDKALTSHAATPETLLAALAQTGKARLLYRIEQPVNVFSTKTIIGSSEPVITGTRTTGTGNTINAISYQNVGFIVQLSAQGSPKDQNSTAPMVTTAIKLSVLSPAEEEIAPGQKGSAIRVMSLDHSEALELNQPHVVLAISSNAFSSFRGSEVGNGRAEIPATPVAYAIRYQFGPPAQGPASAAATSPVERTAFESKPASLPMAAPKTAPSTNTFTAQFQATVYEVEAATNSLPALDLNSVEGASTPELLLNALSNAGKPRVFYSIDQPVNVFADEVTIRTNKPIVSGTRWSSNGEAINSYTSHSMGVIMRFSAQAPPKEAKRKGPDVTVSFNLSDEASSGVEFALGQKYTALPMISQEHNEPLEFGRPRVILAMGASSTVEQAKPFVYLIRYQFSPPASR